MKNYRMIALQAGDALKSSTTMNEIGRAAQSVFPFGCDTFPNESITSVRAKKIHDWVLSLARQSMTESERDDQLIRFLELLAVSDEDRSLIADVLKKAGLQKQNLGKNREKKRIFYERSFHPEICLHCSELFCEDHYFHAVFEAAKIYHKAVQIKSKSEKDGQALMLHVWNPEKGTLKVTRCESETDRNVQEGLGFLSTGLMRAVRNPTAHEPAHEWPISEQDCLEILGFISFLMRKCDEAVYYGGCGE
jgi:uncharacterized protein (TIGR02391 family)